MRGAIIGAISWLLWWFWWRRMANDDFATRAMILLIATMFLGGAINSVVENGLGAHPRQYGYGVLGLVLLLLAGLWPRLETYIPALAASLGRVASDARVWLGLLLLVWIYGSVANLILLRQRYQMGEVIEKDMVPFRRALERWVVPRRLTPEQIKSIGAYLAKYPPQTVTFVLPKHDEEASQFRGDMFQALLAGGWNAMGVEYSDDVTPGFKTNFQQTMESQQRSQDPRNPPNADKLVRDAFQQAGIPFEGGSSGSGVHITQNVLKIEVGPRRRDTHAIPVPWNSKD